MSLNWEAFKLWNDDGRELSLAVMFSSSTSYALLKAVVEKDGLSIDIAEWPVSYEPPNSNDEGYVQIGNGRIEIAESSTRGIGVGSLLMIPIVRWIKARPHVVPVANIDLEANDARTVEAKNRRNRFYEKLGFTFDYKDGGLWGVSKAMSSSALIEPPFGLPHGWHIERIDGEGQVF